MSTDFTLRVWNEDDAESITRYAGNPKIAANLRDLFPHPYSLDDARAYISACIESASSRDIFRAIDVNGEAVGSIGAFLQNDVYRKSAEIGYWLAEPFWGCGIMTRAVREITQLAFERFDIVRVYAEPYADNAGSRRVLEKAGFKLEGVLEKSVYKNGSFHDSCIYALVR